MMFLILLNGFFVFDSDLRNYTILSDNTFLKTVSDETQVDIDTSQISNVQNKLDGSDSTTNVLGFFDAFTLVVDFIKFLFGFLLAFPTFLINATFLNLETKFFFFIPMFFTYMYSLFSWVRTGSD